VLSLGWNLSLFGTTNYVGLPLKEKERELATLSF